ncbi:hypothetical protein INR49_022274 [Caranx melampygus]|nr:hypothetical protein INR49_022274 [Caranx melampygus]
MGALLRGQGFTVSYCPTLPEDSDIIIFLRALGIDWPTAPANWTNEEREEKIQEALENCPYRERESERGRRTSGGGGRKVEGENDGALRVNLKLHRDSVSQLAQLDLATADCTVAMATTLHAEERTDEGGIRDEVRRSSQTWDDIIRVMTSATVRFELLSTVHTSPVTLDVQREGGVSTKGPRGGVFVMYNCARLHTLFDSYERGGEWLLLFNYLIPFSELLDQSGQALEGEGGGARVNIKTEQICKFLVSLSKDFSSYYNRVHVLGEPLPHLFNQMFCRLYLLRALRELYHSALDSLNLPPIRQL